jgi:cytochrome P450
VQQATDLDLPYLAMDEDAFAADPYPRFAAAREKHPWLATSPFGYVINDFKAIRDLFRDESKLDNPYDGMLEMMGAKGTPWGRFQENHLLNQSGAAHKRLRDILAPAFTPRQAKRHRPLMREVISNVLDEWAPKGSFDFEEFASYFPVTVMCKLIGASPDAIPPLRSSLEALGLSTSMDKNILPQLQQATVTMEAFVTELMAGRRQEEIRSEEPDLLDILLTAQDNGGLSDGELANILIFLFAAGYDTSKNILTFIMLEMISRPDLYARCAEDIDFCRKVIDETFRYHSTANAMRMLGEDIVYRDVLIPKGSMVWFPINIIGRDPRMADTPDTFEPERKQKNPPMPFGLGTHICLGQFIARAQLEEGLHLIAQRIRGPRSPGPAGWRPYAGVWGIRGLPIAFEPEGARPAKPLPRQEYSISSATFEKI